MNGLTDDERQALLTDQSLSTLPAAFAAVPDPRSRHGQRYDLPFLLTCLVAALLCDCDSLEAVGQWCRDHCALLARRFGPRRHLTPTGSLYRRLLPRLSVAHLEAAVAAWVRHTRPVRDLDPLAMDGKTVRGAGTATQPAPHRLSVSTHQTHETLVGAVFMAALSEALPRVLTSGLATMEQQLRAVSRRVCGAVVERVIAVQAAGLERGAPRVRRRPAQRGSGPRPPPARASRGLHPAARLLSVRRLRAGTCAARCAPGAGATVALTGAVAGGLPRRDRGGFENTTERVAEAVGVTVSEEVVRRMTEGMGAVAEAEVQAAIARVQ